MNEELTFKRGFPSLSRFNGLRSELSGERYLPTEKIVQCCVDKQRLQEAAARFKGRTFGNDDPDGIQGEFDALLVELLAFVGYCSHCGALNEPDHLNPYTKKTCKP